MQKTPFNRARENRSAYVFLPPQVSRSKMRKTRRRLNSFAFLPRGSLREDLEAVLNLYFYRLRATARHTPAAYSTPRGGSLGRGIRAAIGSQREAIKFVAQADLFRRSNTNILACGEQAKMLGGVYEGDGCREAARNSPRIFVLLTFSKAVLLY